MAYDLTRFGAEQSFSGIKRAYDEYHMHKSRNIVAYEKRKAWIAAKDYRQVKVLTCEEKLKTLVCLIMRHAEVNYHKHKTGRTVSSDFRFCEVDSNYSL